MFEQRSQRLSSLCTSQQLLCHHTVHSAHGNTESRQIHSKAIDLSRDITCSVVYLQTKGEVLGRLRGVSVKMLMHHSRNSEQKQWDETLVLALSGMGRLLRAHLPLLVPMQAFPQVLLLFHAVFFLQDLYLQQLDEVPLCLRLLHSTCKPSLRCCFCFI